MIIPKNEVMSFFMFFYFFVRKFLPKLLIYIYMLKCASLRKKSLFQRRPMCRLYRVGHEEQPTLPEKKMLLVLYDGAKVLSSEKFRLSLSFSLVCSWLDQWLFRQFPHSASALVEFHRVVSLVSSRFDT